MKIIYTKSYKKAIKDRLEAGKKDHDPIDISYTQLQKGITTEFGHCGDLTMAREKAMKNLLKNPLFYEQSETFE